MLERANSNFLKVVGKTFRVLEALAHAKNGVHISELSRAIGQPKATIFRILFTLRQLGYVQKDDSTEAYRLTLQIRELTQEKSREILRRAAKPLMERLRGQFEQTVNLAVIDQGRVFYLEILDGLRSIRMSGTVNTYGPAYATALGKAMLAFVEPGEAAKLLAKMTLTQLTPKTTTTIGGLQKQLHKFRNQGFALDDEEVDLGARCVAAPIFSSEGQPFAAISVSGPTNHIRPQDVKEIAQAIVIACANISAQMGYTKFQ